MTAMRVAAVAAGLAGMLGMAGCGMTSATDATAAAPVTARVMVHGTVFGGQQPIAGATIQLYAAGTGGYGSASTALLKTAVTTDATGMFNITGDYTCPSAATQVYITGTGGNPGSGTNANLGLMAALGNCGDLGPSTFVNMNEVTTVGSVWALAPFMSGYANVGTTSTNTAGLVRAFAAVNKLVSISRGLPPGEMLPPGATVPLVEIYTLADILGSCVNSTGGTAGDATVCGKLFTAATPPGGPAPTDTVGAALNIARYPGNNVAALYVLPPPTAPFQPTLVAQPTDWTISVTYTAGGMKAPSASAVDASGNVWVANAGGNSVSVLASSGSPVSGSPFSTGAGTAPAGVALDASGNAWITGKGNSTVSALGAGGTPLAGSPFSGGGLNAPAGLAVDASGVVWVANSGNNSVSAFSSTGTAISPSSGYAGGGITAPVAVAVNPK